MRSTDPIQIHISIQCPHTLHGVSATAKNIVLPSFFMLLLLYVNPFYLSMTFNIPASCQPGNPKRLFTQLKMSLKNTSACIENTYKNTLMLYDRIIL